MYYFPIHVPPFRPVPMFSGITPSLTCLMWPSKGRVKYMVIQMYAVLSNKTGLQNVIDKKYTVKGNKN
jgi:hypothetical protein